MYGPNIFAVLTAYDQKNKASSAFKLEHNSTWFCKAAGGVAVEPTISSRETTPADDEAGAVNEAGTVDRLLCLSISYSHWTISTMDYSWAQTRRHVIFFWTPWNERNQR